MATFPYDDDRFAMFASAPGGGGGRDNPTPPAEEDDDETPADAPAED
jgi:hypothetical protein